MIDSIIKKITNFLKTIFVKNKEQKFLQIVKKVNRLVNFSNTMFFSDAVWIFYENNWKGKHDFIFKESDHELIKEISSICQRNNINLFICEYGMLFIDLKNNNSKFIKTKDLRKIKISFKNNKDKSDYDLNFQKYIHVICSMLIQETDESSGLFIISNFQSNHKFFEMQEKYFHFNVINSRFENTKKNFPNDCHFMIFKDGNFHFISHFSNNSYIIPWFYYSFTKKDNA